MAIVKVLDFLNDGTSDVLWRNRFNGALTLWEVSSSGVVTANSVTFAGNPVVPNSSWFINAIGDFTGDHKADVVWRNAVSGELDLWAMNGSVITNSSQITDSLGHTIRPDTSWTMVGDGDFNGDGTSDLLWRNQNTGAMAEWLMNGSTITASISPTLNALPATLDNSWLPQTNPTNFA
jgi:hypothetical protein